jgi:hypothetical protein
VPRFDLGDFLQKTGFSLKRLATYLRVAPTYLEAALAGTIRLTTRDQQACRLLWRRLFQAKQMPLPFAEPLETFTRTHARSQARARAAGSMRTGEGTRSGRARSSRPAKGSRIAKSRRP